MTAIEKVCALLDERGVKWTDHGYENHIWWKGFDGVRWHAENRPCVDGWRVKVEAVLTPEQAIVATLGRGECRIENRHGDWYCTGCGDMVGTYDTESELHIDGNAIELWHFCPNCGKKVVDE